MALTRSRTVAAPSPSMATSIALSSMSAIAIASENMDASRPSKLVGVIPPASMRRRFVRSSSQAGGGRRMSAKSSASKYAYFVATTAFRTTWNTSSTMISTGST